jgi:hypothetical protein
MKGPPLSIVAAASSHQQFAKAVLGSQKGIFKMKKGNQEVEFIQKGIV